MINSSQLHPPYSKLFSFSIHDNLCKNILNVKATNSQIEMKLFKWKLIQTKSLINPPHVSLMKILI